MRKIWRFALSLSTMLLILVLAGGASGQTADPLINEFVFNHAGTDTNAFIEIYGAPDTDYLGYAVLEIEGDGSGAGVIDAVLPVGTTNAGGFWVSDEDAENGTVTLLLVEGFTGAPGDDLDSDNDGVRDSAPWTRVVDSVAVADGDSGDWTYSTTTLTPGYDGMAFAPGGASRIPNGTDTDAVSDWVRNDFDGAGFPGFAGTPEVGEAYNTPGAVNALIEPPPAPPELTIMEIQGTGQRSPYEGELVTTTGVVTLLSADGRDMWIQDPAGDGEPATSDGIFVDDRDRLDPPPVVGDMVRLTAFVEEQQFGTSLPLTRLNSPDTHEPYDVLSSGNPLPDPVELRDLPDTSIPEGEIFCERLEGMLVEVRNGSVTAPTNGFGEFGLLAEADAKPGSGYYSQTKQILIRGLGDERVDYNPERIQVDDYSLEQPIVVRPGDQIRMLVGVVDYTFSMYKLQPVEYEIKTHDLPKLPASSRSGARGNAVITTLNVENLFDLVDNPEKEDEGSTPSPEALDVKLSKLALAIEVELDLPDILIVQEVENTAILQELGDRVNEAAGTDYHAVSFETSDVRGIEVGFLWDADRVDLLDAYQMSGPAVDAWFGPTSPSPGREPLVGEFMIRGYEVTVIGNHFKSKGGDDPLYGVTWPPSRITEVQRKGQARAVRSFVDDIFAEHPNALVLVAGDLNDFQFSEPGEGPDNPVAILEGIDGGIPLYNLVEMEKPAETFSYVFDGNSQLLDHMLVSPALRNLTVGADILHFNAGYPAILEDDPGTPLASSDHDAVEGRFSLR